ncbi:uncharacterized protein BDZ99DRAFT_64790 [Mytilinidion resinicola]|uniref:Uncharacterized protein n=1 Tax=Mytilinidion resinicola TaxID=574789 RepID=A0A6A6YGN1_9PEZI|nr:uncharacterized protein BDZ99DRAFT_64790 [Mytilinidion resinicola]KAF2807738.1 hypothetical protein BDZ99DRAFT_64790 [Mytilinidion resinicola]
MKRRRQQGSKDGKSERRSRERRLATNERVKREKATRRQVFGERVVVGGMRLETLMAEAEGAASGFKGHATRQGLGDARTAAAATVLPGPWVVFAGALRPKQQ